jgi:tetratricopeptide (TPR) repeat protein
MEPVSQAPVSSVDRAAPQPPLADQPEPNGNGHAPAASRIVIPPATPAAPLDPKDEQRARRLVQRGRLLYAKGEYDKAEEALKEAVTLYPFIAEANLALGKIFLIRGSAGRDRAMVNSARLMFDRAHALDPELREAAVLLQLFQAAPPE